MLVEYSLSMTKALVDCNEDEDRLNDLERLERLHVSYIRCSQCPASLPFQQTAQSRRGCDLFDRSSKAE